MSDCIFCKLANGEIPTEVVCENELACAFRDANPQAPTHVLVVPKAHHANFVDSVPAETLASMERAVAAVAEKCGIAESGFRCIMNTGAAAGQTVMHLHMHVLGGAPMGEGLL